MAADPHEDARPTPVALALMPINASASLRNQAYTRLKQAIAEADIYRSREDVRLDEKELTEALGVSRTPVREAMTLLEQEGFCAQSRGAESISCGRRRKKSSR